ncbi:hypothetical protein PIB19_17095 [Sphingomonas sp. 7/4-4]|uniref:hypothetical protein n=1 Tax=Sphingomonas sp. 7/4-4 TaxID=3018446 RepID=UPI0022F4012F|nr:hypothetical protein [Sphingomonas sp. 7/4-4]WBY07116.1 hypothetical protein PIB19_17095 [Sphingomonas sp. 7/4-4]
MFERQHLQPVISRLQRFTPLRDELRIPPPMLVDRALGDPGKGSRPLDVAGQRQRVEKPLPPLHRKATRMGLAPLPLSVTIGHDQIVHPVSPETQRAGAPPGARPFQRPEGPDSQFFIVP